MPVSSAICDIVTDSNPCSATRATVVARIASRTSRRCSSIVSFHSFGTAKVYATLPAGQSDLTKTLCLVNYPSSRSLPATEEDTDMADPPRSPDPRPPSAPRWVKLLGIIAIVLALLVIVILIAGGGEHG